MRCVRGVEILGRGYSWDTGPLRCCLLFIVFSNTKILRVPESNTKRHGFLMVFGGERRCCAHKALKSQSFCSAKMTTKFRRMRIQPKHSSVLCAFPVHRRADTPPPLCF